MGTKKPADTSIWDYIKDLLHQHDCVIVPGFGGFVCNREPSKIDQVSHIITPPSRKVVFNQNLKSNDGLLAGYLAQQQGITYNDAIQFIAENVEQTMNVLQDQKQLMIDLFGNFRLNADANYVFLPDKRNNYLTSSYGLSLIQASPVSSRAIKVGKAKIFRDIQTPQKARKSRNVWPTVLAGVLVLLLSVNGYIFLSDHSLSDLRIGGENTMSITSWFDSLFSKNDSVKPVAPIVEPTIETADKQEFIPAAPAPIDTTAKPVEPAPETAERAVVPADKPSQNLDDYAHLYAFAAHFTASRGVIVFPQQTVEETIPDETEGTVTPEEAAVPVLATPIKPKAAHLSTVGIAQGYYVIGGVFCKERNAKRFIRQLNEAGYAQAELLVNADINCKRVSYQRFNSRKEAEQFCKEIKNESNPGAWVLAAE
jgi:nucleoid DNA-binding protein